MERYPFVTEDPTLLYNWVCDGCLAQINATGLIRDGHTAKWLHKLIEWNLVHILCSDCHHPVKRPPNLAEGFAHLPDRVARRMQRNAIDIYLGDDLRPPEPTKPVYRFGHWVNFRRQHFQIKWLRGWGTAGPGGCAEIVVKPPSLRLSSFPARGGKTGACRRLSVP